MTYNTESKKNSFLFYLFVSQIYKWMKLFYLANLFLDWESLATSLNLNLEFITDQWDSNYNYMRQTNLQRVVCKEMRVYNVYV